MQWPAFPFYVRSLRSKDDDEWVGGLPLPSLAARVYLVVRAVWLSPAVGGLRGV